MPLEANIEQRTEFEINQFQSLFCDIEKSASVQTENLIKSVGSIAVKEYEKSTNSRFDTLMSAIREAKNGDPEALAQVRINVLTDMMERTLKKGHVLSVETKVDEDGKLYQNGQYIDDVQKNALEYASDDEIILQRTHAEIRNSFRIEQANRLGLLEDNYLVVFSLCPEGLSDKELQDRGFFAPTKSLAIQATSSQRAAPFTESAFIAGVKSPHEERHDIDTVIKIADMFGGDYSEKTISEIIDTPLYIPKKFMQNGVIDIVKIFDDIAGGTFFGEDKPRQDYLEYLKKCDERESSFEPQVDWVVKKLLEAESSINNPVQATQLLNKLSQETMVNRAIYDSSIEATVFGAAAEHIKDARFYNQAGLVEQATRSLNIAQSKATSSSCPAALKKQIDGLNNNPEGESTNKESDSSNNDGLIRCYKCKEQVPKKEVVKPESWCCPKCEYEVDVCTGKIINPGKVKIMEKPSFIFQDLELILVKRKEESKKSLVISGS